jgi:hypothetical protein
MKKFAFAAVALLLSASAFAAEHGFVSPMMHDDVSDGIFRVNIEKVNGKEPHMGINQHVHTGKNTVTVSLVFNASWGQGMADTSADIYTKDIELNVEKGKNYYLGAKVDTKASQAAQADGSFWEPVIAEVH